VIDRRRRRVSRRRTGGEGCQGASGCRWIIARGPWEGKGEVAREVQAYIKEHALYEHALYKKENTTLDSS